MVSSNAALSQTSDPTGIESGPDFSRKLKGLSTDALQELCHLLREDVWRLLGECDETRREGLSETRSR
jgi:hypothetical protein